VKDEKFVPGLIACFVLGISLITLPALLNKTGIPALSNLPTISWKVAVISCIAAWTVGLLIAMPRIRYNVMKTAQAPRGVEKSGDLQEMRAPMARLFCVKACAERRDLRMKLTNENIWKAGAFNGMRVRHDIVSGPRRLQWGRLVGQVDSILRGNGRLIVVVAATGDDPRNPTCLDIRNAQLASLIVSKQWRYRLVRRKVTAYLKYAPHTQVEVAVNLEKTLAETNAYFSQARNSDTAGILPTHLLSYLMNRKSQS